MVANMHREHIKKIIEHGTTSQMVELRDVLVGLVDYLKCNDYEQYLCTEYEINKIANGGHIGEELAKCWVSKMENKDGTRGEHWSMEQVANAMKEKNVKHDLSDFYTVINMMYSDFYNSRFDTTTYIDMAKDWLDDKDVGGCKLLKYYYFVTK